MSSPLNENRVEWGTLGIIYAADYTARLEGLGGGLAHPFTLILPLRVAPPFRPVLPADWLGSSRLASTPSRTVYYDGAYAPFGESYAEMGTTSRSFTDQNQDTVTGLYDFLFREYSPVQGRWISPDPLGAGASDPVDPQSWNRYAYVGNMPLTAIDPLGLVFGPREDAVSPVKQGGYYSFYDPFGFFPGALSTIGGVYGWVPWNSEDPSLQPASSGSARITMRAYWGIVEQPRAGFFLAAGGGRDVLGRVGRILEGEVRRPNEGLIECVSRTQEALLGKTGSTVLNITAISGIVTAYATTAEVATTVTLGTAKFTTNATLFELFADVAGGSAASYTRLLVAGQVISKVAGPVAAVSTGISLGFYFACR